MIQQMIENLVANFNWKEIVGLIGMAITLVSFLMVSTKWIRIVSLGGEVVLLFYGLLISSLTTFVLNVALIVIQIVMLAKQQHEQAND